MRRPTAGLIAALFTSVLAIFITSLSPAYAAGNRLIRMPSATAADVQVRVQALAAGIGQQRTYVISDGDTLTSVARDVLGSARDWPELWWANRKMISRPDVLKAGQELVVPGRTSPRAAVVRAALTALAPPAPTPVDSSGPGSNGNPPPVGSSPPPAPVTPTGGAFEQCVIRAESGGVPTAWYPGHTDGSLPPAYSSVAEGLYGFLLSTWQGLGLGYSQGASFAPAGVQREGFLKLYAEAGTSPWVSDGCAGTAAVAPHTSSVDVSGQGASGSGRSRRADLRTRAWRWALKQAGKPYEWGGTGPSGFDCSGLVYEAYGHMGTWLPRTTYDMLASPKLRRVYRPRRGDLAFYGSGHVELFRHWGQTYGAHHTGTVISVSTYSSYYHPSAFYRVR